MNKANHQVNIIRITEIKEHTNADTLVIIPIGGYQVVAKKDQFHVGDLAVYIQPDSVVPQTEPFRFIWQPYLDDRMNNPALCKHVDENGKSTVMNVSEIEQNTDYICLRCHMHNPYSVPEKKRRITVRKFRKEWSEGLLLPVTDFTELRDITMTFDYPEGNDVSDLLGITHYDPDDESSTRGDNTKGPRAKKSYPRSVRGWAKFVWRKVKNFFGFGGQLDVSTDNISLGIPIYDVDSYKAKPADFVEGEEIRITEKIHGSNARYIYLDGTMYAGSRKLWKSENSTCIFRRALKELPWIEEWCKTYPGYVLWGELTPTQGGYDYGSKKVQFFVFDVYTPDGKWVDESTEEGKLILAGLSAYMVPVYYKGPYHGYDHVKEFVDGPSQVLGANHIREGVVVATTNRNGNRSQRKIVSNVFLEKDNK